MNEIKFENLEGPNLDKISIELISRRNGEKYKTVININSWIVKMNRNSVHIPLIMKNDKGEEIYSEIVVNIF